MPEHLRALVVILAAATAVFLFAKRPVCATGTLASDFGRRRNLWFAVALIAFLSHNFWVYVALCGVLVGVFAARDRNPLALYCLIVFCVPMYDMPVPGFGLVNYLFEINHVRLLNLVILLPVALRLARGSQHRAHMQLPDYLMLGYLGLVFILNLISQSFTVAMRGTFYLFVDIWLPYYVFTRSVRSLADFREIIAALVVGLVIQALIAFAEWLRSWLLYSSLRVSLGADRWNHIVYLRRGEGGALRANASFGNSIVLGYVLSVGLLLMTYLLPAVKSRLTQILILGAFAAGIVASLSRGPWVGLAVMLALVLMLGPGGIKRAAMGSVVGLVALGLLLVSPYAQVVIDHLPFVGTVETENIDYRERLLEVSLLVVQQNLWFGALDFMRNPMLEVMRQGQGIIDIVNTYLQVALSYGVMGLTLFVLIFLSSIHAAWRARRDVLGVSADAERLGRTLIAVMIGIMVTIFTVSSIGAISLVYWMVIALCVAYAAMVREHLATSRQVVPRAAHVLAAGGRG